MKVKVRDKEKADAFVPAPRSTHPRARQPTRPPSEAKPARDAGQSKPVVTRSPHDIAPDAVRSLNATQVLVGGVPMLRQHIEQLERAFEEIETPDRMDRAAHWALRSELRKLRMLDHFLNRFIGG